MRKIQLRLISYLVMLYMLVALGWWSYLLFSKNHAVYEAQTSFVKLQQIAEQHANGTQSPHYTELVAAEAAIKNKKESQEWMILGETIVFITVLFAGLYLDCRRKERKIILRQPLLVRLYPS